MPSSAPNGVGRVNRWTWNSGQRLEIYYYQALAFSQHNTDLVFDEESMKPEKLTKALENAGIDPSSMRVSTWYLEPTREDDDPYFRSSTRASDFLVEQTGRRTRDESLSKMTKTEARDEER